MSGPEWLTGRSTDKIHIFTRTIPMNHTTIQHSLCTQHRRNMLTHFVLLLLQLLIRSTWRSIYQATRKWTAIGSHRKLKNSRKMFYCCRFSCSLFDLLCIARTRRMKFSRSLTKIYLTLANIMRIGCVGDGSKLFCVARMTSVRFDSRDYFGFMLRSTEHNQHNQGRNEEKYGTKW